MKCKWDFSEFYEFAEKLENDNTIEDAYMAATRKIAQALHKYLLQLTPVDTGNLRKMWSAGDNLKFEVKPVVGGYEVTFINKARSQVSSERIHDGAALSDDEGFMYGVAVNDGHKTPGGFGWVMGKFFVEKSIYITEPLVNSIINSELNKWWGKL